MKFGIHFQLPCADWQSPLQRYQETLDQIQLGDELGFDYSWLAEMHFNPQMCITPSPLLLSAAAAQRTKRIHLGVAVNLVPLHHPIRLAEDLAELDLLSNGRVEFGAGRGQQPDHYQGLDVPIEESRERMIEGLEMVIKAWTHERLTFEGKYFSAKDLLVVPKPLQKPHPRVRVASNSPDSFELVGKLGYDIHATPIVLPTPNLREGVETYRQTLLANGHPVNGEELSLQIPVFVAKSAEEARAATEERVTYCINTTRELFNTPETRETAKTNSVVAILLEHFKKMTYDRWCNDFSVYGEPADCIEKLEALEQDFKPWEVNCWFNPGGLIESSRVMESMKLFAKEVMPHFH